LAIIATNVVTIVGIAS